METLLDSASQEGLIYLCVIMSVIALFLAVAIVYEMIFKNKKEQKEINVKENTLNIKEDSNITYEELSKDEEVRRAKEELEKVKQQLVIKEQQEKAMKEKIALEEQNKAINDSKIENIVNRKLENNIEDVGIKEENKVVNTTTNTKELNKVVNDQEIENIVNKKLESTYKELVEDNKIIEQTTNNVEKVKEENTVNNNTDIDVSKYNKLLSNETNQTEVNTTTNKEETVNKTETNEAEEYDRVSEATKERIIDEYLKKFYKESKNNNRVMAEIKDNSQDKEESIQELQENINNEFKENTSLFEELEEENAIISYDELKKAANFGYTDEEMDKYADEKDAIISFDELEKLYKEINNIKDDTKSTTSYKEDFVIPSYEYKRVKDLPEISSEKIFKKSDIISPIYGIKELDNKTKSDTLIKLNEEIKRTNEFLKMLKDLKKNLE